MKNIRQTFQMVLELLIILKGGYYGKTKSIFWIGLDNYIVTSHLRLWSDFGDHNKDHASKLARCDFEHFLVPNLLGNRPSYNYNTQRLDNTRLINNQNKKPSSMAFFGVTLFL